MKVNVKVILSCHDPSNAKLHGFHSFKRSEHNKSLQDSNTLNSCKNWQKLTLSKSSITMRAGWIGVRWTKARSGTGGGTRDTARPGAETSCSVSSRLSQRAMFALARQALGQVRSYGIVHHHYFLHFYSLPDCHAENWPQRPPLRRQMHQLQGDPSSAEVSERASY